MLEQLQNIDTWLTLAVNGSHSLWLDAFALSITSTMTWIAAAAMLLYVVIRSGEMKDIPIHGFFLAIGHHPNSEPFRPWIEVNAEGYILTKGKTSHTNVEGVFAAGDVQDPRYRQAITAAAGGCMAAIDAERYLSEQL